ncbi:MAG TPA: hypothetical protein VF838_18865 [Trebonia sp.]
MQALTGNPALAVVRPNGVIGAVVTHRRALDSGKDMAPALVALALTVAYLAIFALG